MNADPHLNGHPFQALGQTIAYDEYKGDFNRAQRISDQWISDARQMNNADALAEAMIWRSIIHILQGEPLAAANCAAEIERLAPQDANRRLRALSYNLLSTYERFNSFPTGAGAGAVEITARWQGGQDLKEQDARWRELLGQATDPAAQNEAWFIYAFLCTLKAARSILDNARYLSISREKILQTTLDTPMRFQQTVQAAGSYGLAAYADWCIADLYRRAGESALAQQCLEQAKQMYRQANDLIGVALCLMTQADWQCAPFSTPLAWNMALQDSGTEGSNLSVQHEMDEFSSPSAEALDGARRDYAAAEQLFVQSSASRGLAAVWLRRGYLAMLDGDYAAAMDWIKQSCDQCKQCGDYRSYYLAQTHLVMSLIGAGQWTEKTGLAREIGVWGEQTGGFSFSLGLGVLLNRWARHWLIRCGDYERALAGYQAAQALFDAIGASVNVSQNIVDQGLVYQAIGERAAALNYYEQALDRYTADLIAHPSIADNLRQRVLMLASKVFDLYLQHMNPEGMERSAARLKTQVAQFPDINGEGLSALLTGRLARLISDESTSEGMEGPSQIESWALRQLAQTNIEISSVLTPLYRFRQTRDAGDALSAERFLTLADSALSQVSEANRGFLEVSVLVEKKQFEQAAAACKNHLLRGEAEKGFAGLLTQAMKTVGGLHAEAESRLQQQRKHEQAFTVFVRSKAYQEAKSHLDELERLANKVWWAQDPRPWQPLCDCAEMYEGLGDLSTAIEHYDQAITQLEMRRGQLSRDDLKTAIASDKGAQYLYFQAARTAMRMGDHVRSFQYAERGKARGLLDLMAGGAVMLREPEKERESMRAWRRLNAQLTLWRGLLALERGKPSPNADVVEQYVRQIAEDEKLLNQIEAELARSNPIFHQSLSVEATTLTLEQVVAALPPDAVLLEYCFLAKELLGWAITREGFKRSINVSIDVGELSRDIRAFHRACEKRADTESLSGRLAETFLTPFADLIRESSLLIIIPYGEAHTLPFQALTFEGKPLCASVSVSYLPSASILQFLKLDAPPKACDRILAVGNPTLDLPEAATEAAFVAGLFGQTPLLGVAATKQAVSDLLPDYPLIHFATHGKLSESAPLSSAIMLAHDKELTVYELMGLQLNADLVVLSACNTGQGETTGGDDVLGLTRGLLAAGARAAVVSLWPVDDFSTCLLMGAFYRRLRMGEKPAFALRAAQEYLRNLGEAEATSELNRIINILENMNAPITTLQSIVETRKTRHASPVREEASANFFSYPYYWAPFILVG
jgi:CHAT domain-containing protein